MRKVKVRHQPLPGIGDLFELHTSAGLRVKAISQRSGRCDIAIGETSGGEPEAIARLTRAEAAVLLQLLGNAHTEIITTTD